MSIPTLFANMRSVCVWLIAVFIITPFSAGATTLNGATIIAGDAVEGGMIIARVPAGARVTLDDEPLPMDAEGQFIVGFHRDSPDAIILQIIAADGARIETIIRVRQRLYDIQRIDGLKSSYVSPPTEVMNRINDDAERVRNARQRLDAGSQGGNFLQGLDMPVAGRITGVFGSQRILNGQPRAPHYGIDIAAPRGTAVLAPAGGRVTLVRELYFSGWTVLVAHGMGLNSAFLHLDDVAVQTGDVIGRGAVIGSVGSTGRSTGPHLDWRLDWQGRRLDAALVRRQIADASQQR